MRIPESEKHRLALSNFDTLRLLTIYEPFQKDVARIRAAVGVPEGGYKDWNEGMWWTFNFMTKRLDDYMKFREVVAGLLRKYRVSWTILETVIVYIRTGIVQMPQLFGYNIHHDEDEHKIIVEIPDNQWLTKKDSVLMRAEIDEIVGQRLRKKRSRTRVRPNIDRDIAILREWHAGKTMTDLELAARIFASNLEDNNFDMTVAADRRRAKLISQARRRLLGEMKKRFGNA